MTGTHNHVPLEVIISGLTALVNICPPWLMYLLALRLIGFRPVHLVSILRLIIKL